MKAPKLTTMGFTELVRHREAVNAEIVKRSGEMRAQLARLEKASGALQGPRLVTAATKKTKYKLPARYRDPKTGKTWAGRGNTPKWIKGPKAAYLIKPKAA
jgi:DNA-binding protein H-NS